MLGRIKITKNKMIRCQLFLLTSLFVCLCFKWCITQDQVIELAQSQLFEKQCNCERLLVNTYLLRIEQISEKFYKEYYTINPTVDSNSVTVKEFISDPTHSYVTFTTKPFIGPHDTIGIDEITFSADYIGTVQLETFKHIISYSLPDNLKDLEKKRIPGKYK